MVKIFDFVLNIYLIKIIKYNIHQIKKPLSKSERLIIFF